MGNDVIQVKLGDVCDFLGGFAFKSEDLNNFCGVPVVKIKNVNDKIVTLDDVQFFPIDKISDKHSKFLLQHGDVLIAMTGQGSVGRVGRFYSNGERVLLNQRVGKFLPKKTIDLGYLYYILSSEKYEQILFNSASGSGQPNLSPDIIKSVLIPYVPLAIQKKISYVLTTLDRKITLNRQINQTLEQMAQTLFKSWFVDFDPVIDNALDAGSDIPDTLQERAEQRRLLRAKSDFKPLPAETRALFPSEFEETELGWVPKGWEVKNLGELVTVKRGGSPRPIQDFLVPEGLPWVKISDATASDSRFLSTTKEFIKPEGLNKTVLLQKGELILSNSATPGLPKFLELDACIHDGWLYFPEKRHISDLYLYQLFLEIRPLLVQQGNGSVFTNLKTDILKQHSMVVPTSNVLRSFEKQVFAFHSKIQQVNQENQSLQKIRDILLPQLISGELALDDLPEDVAEAAEVL